MNIEITDLPPGKSIASIEFKIEFDDGEPKTGVEVVERKDPPPIPLEMQEGEF